MRSKGIDGVIRFRRALKKLITWRGVFDHFILACILTNCLFLALSDPSASPLYRYQLSSTLMLSVIDDDARSYSELSARHAHLLSAGRHLGRAQAAAIIRDAWLRR